MYDLDQVAVPDYPSITASRLLWREELEGTARALLADVETDEGDEARTVLADAKGFLEGLLADGPVLSKTALADAKQAGHARATIWRAMTNPRGRGAQGRNARWVGFGATAEDAQESRRCSFQESEQAGHGFQRPGGSPPTIKWLLSFADSISMAIDF